MKKLRYLALISGVLLACNNGERGKDMIVNKIDSTVENTMDSVKKDLKNRKEQIKEKLEGRDSLRK